MLSRPTSHTRRALWMDRKWMCGMCVRHTKVGHKSIFFLMFLSILLQFHLRHWLFFVVKVCDKAHIAREKKQEYIIREKSALLRLKNEKGIITLFCTFQSTSKLFFALTLARNGDLLKHIAELGKLPLNCAKFYAGELLVAIEGMHRNNVIHRDLKPGRLALLPCVFHQKYPCRKPPPRPTNAPARRRLW